MKINVIRSFILTGFLFIQTSALHSQEAERLQALAANDISPTFSLTLTSKSPEYRAGSIIWIKIVQTNLTKHDIDCTEEWDGIDRTYDYEATDEYGKPAEKRHRGNAGWDIHSSTMAVGEYATREIQIERIFKLDRPGKYTIRVSRREPFLKDERGEPLVVWSNPITITITG
ncbi:MAG: hypothetical protein ACLPXT_14110 [Terracidiphilus sp.]